MGQKMDPLRKIARDIMQKTFSEYTLVPSFDRYQRHRSGVQGKYFCIVDPAGIRHYGNCKVPLKKGDVLYCARHSGDCFMDYALCTKIGNKYIPTAVKFGAYDSFEAMEEISND